LLISLAATSLLSARQAKAGRFWHLPLSWNPFECMRSHSSIQTARIWLLLLWLLLLLLQYMQLIK